MALQGRLMQLKEAGTVGLAVLLVEEALLVRVRKKGHDWEKWGCWQRRAQVKGCQAEWIDTCRVCSWS
jgi:hypothetical protein